jgi:hypothetical protein
MIPSPQPPVPPLSSNAGALSNKRFEFPGYSPRFRPNKLGAPQLFGVLRCQKRTAAVSGSRSRALGERGASGGHPPAEAMVFTEDDAFRLCAEDPKVIGRQNQRRYKEVWLAFCKWIVERFDK